MARVTVARSPTPLLPSVGMSQSSVMLGALLGGFVVYLAINQKLAAYWSILIGGAASSTATTTTAPAASSATPSASTSSPTPAPATSTPAATSTTGSGS